VELVAARYAVRRGEATRDTFAAIRAPLLGWMTDAVVDPASRVAAAESHALAAEWRVSRREDPDGDIRAPLEMADRALATNPRHALALSMRGRLLLARAKSTPETDAKRAAARAAGEAFEAALQANPLLESACGKALLEARGFR